MLAGPRGFCAGVVRAIQIVEKALLKFGPPVYVRHEIVHNKYVLDDLRSKGAVFVKELTDIPPADVDRGCPVIMSAHGVAKAVFQNAKAMNIMAIDATCPLVTKVHLEADMHHRHGRHLIMIGHAGHPEVVGTMGQVPPGSMTLVETLEDVERLNFSSGAELAFVTQTTLSVDDTAKIVAALQQKFPNITPPRKEDICYATTNRQLAVREMASQCDMVVVVGSKNSSNSNRLAEVARDYGAHAAMLIDSARDIDWPALQGIRVMGLTAGASAPEHLVEEIIEAARQHFDVQVKPHIVAEEAVTFKLPSILSA